MSYFISNHTLRPNNWLRIAISVGDELIGYSVSLYGHEDQQSVGTYSAFHDDGYLMIRTPEVINGYYDVYVSAQRREDVFVDTIEITDRRISQIQRQ